MALLFFMDHLMQKNGRRTIHDLSCQFGARGFTEEMRASVGTTQEGLMEFLAQYPSLFILEGDQVILKGYGEVDGKNQLSKMPPQCRQRDYEMEAVDFFINKLEKFGPELQIKSLLGHRSQAAPEVRLVSGRHLKEFCEFLQSKPEYFVVEGDRVRLKNLPEPTEEVVELDDEGRPLAGVKAKQAAVDFLRGVLEKNEDTPIPLDAFYKRFCERYPHSVRQEVATNPKELLAFLKLNRNIFFIRSNKVSLVKTKPEDNGSESGHSSVSGSGESSENNNILFPLTLENLHRIHLVKALKPAQDTVRNIYNDVDAQAEKFVGVDFKLVSLPGQTDEFLSLIIVASTSRIAVFDLAHSDSILLESGLKQLLESDIVHDVKRVSSLLAQRYAVNMQKIFDTQVAHSVIQHERFSKSFTEIKPISFINLQRVYYPQSLMMSDVTPRKLSRNPSWGERPVSNELLLSASEECHSLVVALYRLLNSQLPSSHRRLFEEKCLESLVPNATRPPPQLPAGFTPVPTNAPTHGGVYRPPARRQTSGDSPSPKSMHGASNGTSPFKSNGVTPPPMYTRPQMVDSSTQTLSTGDITVLKVYYEE
ncbi:Protein EGAL-1 b [Aphelenchoides avenae]|nr:Protein EGAL-1 b [Aphelenchus avenae]